MGPHALTCHAAMGTEDSPRVLGALACRASAGHDGPTGASQQFQHLESMGAWLAVTSEAARAILTSADVELPFSVNHDGEPRQTTRRHAGPALPAAHVAKGKAVFTSELRAVTAPITSTRTVCSLQLLAAPVSRSTAAAVLPDLPVASQHTAAALTVAWIDALAPVITRGGAGRFTLTRRRERAAHRRLLTHLAEAGVDDPPAAAVTLAAGIQVPVAAGAWLLNQLAHHRHLQDALGQHPTGPSTQPRGMDLPTAVVWETLRLFPPSWLLPRRVASTTTLAGAQVEQGELVLASPLLLGQDPALIPPPAASTRQCPVHPGPEPADEAHVASFTPERWLTGNARPGAWLPFGAGAHACPGRTLAIAQLTHLTSVTRTHVLTPADATTTVDDRRGLLPRPTTVTWTPRA